MPDKPLPLFEKYRPKKISDIRGQDIAVDKLKAFITAFSRGISKKKAMILHGPAGTGKTTLAHAFANEMSYELFELNASDLRNRAKLDEILKPSTLQQSLFAKGKIILVDEVDGVTSTEYGGLAELIALIEKTKFPVIITCNDIWQSKFSLLRSKCELVQVKELNYLVVVQLIKEIALLEKRPLSERVISEIAAKSRGDLRAALNDLHSIIYFDEEILEEEIQLREKTQYIFNALKEIFKLRANQDTLEVYENVNLELDQIMLWLEENIPAEYRGEELAKAYDALSKADVFRGRIIRQQYWHFLVYQNFFMTAGISAAKGIKNLPQRFIKYNPPRRILKIWMINQKEAKKKSIASKYAEFTHTSKKRAMKEFFLASLIMNDVLIKELELDEQEIEYLNERKLQAIEQIKAMQNTTK